MIQEILVYLTHPHVEAWNFQKRHQEAVLRSLPGVRLKVVHHHRDFLAHLPEAEAAWVWYFKREWCEQARRLKLLVTPAAGTDWIDAGPDPRFAIWHGGFHGPLMAESVVGAALYFCKAFDLSRDMQLQRKWARVKISARLQSLYGARVTVLGFGRIGQTIARHLKAFGCQLTGVKRRLIDPPDYFDQEDTVVMAQDLMEVLKETRHLVVVLPGGAGTDGLLTAEHFRALPEGCFYYNVGRGNVAREEDLIAALRAGTLAGAYLDVFPEEPLPEDSPLWEMKQALIQPHLSAASPHYLDLFVMECVERMKGWE